MRSMLVTVVFSTTLASCGLGTVAEQAAEHGPALHAVMDKLDAIGPLAKAAPRVTEDKIDWPAQDVSATYPERNILFIQLEDFDDLSVRPRLDYRVNNRSPWTDVATLTAWRGTGPPGPPGEDKYIIMRADTAQPEIVGKLFSQFLATRYVLVARTHRYEPAKMVGAQTFEPAIYEGDALVYQLDPPKLLGGYAFEGTNRQQVQTRLGRDKQNLAANLKTMVQGAAGAKLKALTPALKDARITY